MWSIKIYLDDSYVASEYLTAGCTLGTCAACPSELICPSLCEFTEYGSYITCTACPFTCPEGCRNSDTCRLCKDKECLECDAFDGNCTDCITRAHITGSTCVCDADAIWVASSASCEFCDVICSDCLTYDTYFECSTCTSGYLIGNACLYGCPYGFTTIGCTSVSFAVLDFDFDDDFLGTYGIFVTGSQTTQYQFFNSPETVDPIPAYKRGLYFDSGKYLSSNTNIYLSHTFSLGF